MDVRDQRPIAPQRTSSSASSSQTSEAIAGVQRPDVTSYRQKRIACTTCRQAKPIRCNPSGQGGERKDIAIIANKAEPTLKCETSDIASSTCVRCRRLSLSCEVDAGYQRVNKRVKFNELVKEVEQLRSSVGRNASQNSAPNGSPPVQIPSPPVTLYTSPLSYQQTSSATLYVDGPGPAYSQYNEAQPNKSFTQPQQHVPPGMGMNMSVEIRSPVSSTQDRSIDQITLTTEQITILFKEFFEHYHHFLDILDPSLAPDSYYAKSPILFWTIISISARRSRVDPNLFLALSSAVTKLMWSVIPVLPHSRYTVQAMVLLSVWPFPTSSMWSDISYILITIAKSAAMQLGIHRPEFVQDFSRVKTQLSQSEFQDAVKSWVGCYIAAQSITASVGQPSLITNDWAIDQACVLGNKYTLPDNLRHQLLIYRFIARVNKVMAGNDSYSTGQCPEGDLCALISMLEQDFVDLERQITNKLTEIHEILLTMASLQMRIYYFALTSNNDTRKEGLLKGYSTAVNFASVATVADRNWDFILFAPDGFYQMSIFAAMLLMKIIHSSYSRYVDVQAGKSAFNLLLAMIRRASLEENDLKGRGAKIMSQLWNFHGADEKRRNREPSLNIKTRHGASVFHDSLWIWREEFGGQRPSNTGTNQSMVDSIRPVIAQDDSAQAQLMPNSQPHQHQPILSEAGSDMRIPLAAFDPNTGQMIPGMGLQDYDWIWDLGFPSLLEIDPSMLPPSTLQVTNFGPS